MAFKTVWSLKRVLAMQKHMLTKHVFKVFTPSARMIEIAKSRFKGGFKELFFRNCAMYLIMIQY